MFFVYILYSADFDKYYIGQTNDIKKRLSRHNNGSVKSTKPYQPWLLAYTEKFNIRAEAMNREKYLKSLKSKKALKELVEASR
jgi:putative endonuclease